MGGRPSFLKRKKEMDRLDKRRAKAQRKAERRAEAEAEKVKPTDATGTTEAPPEGT